MKKNTEEKLRNYFSDWNYTKHAKLCTALYLGLYTIDMTVSYVILKRLLASDILPGSGSRQPK